MDYNQNKVRRLSEANFEKCSIWLFNQDDDFYHPVSHPDNLPEMMSEDNLCIKAFLTTPKGLEFDGFICGIREEDMYVIGLYVHKQLFLFNKNLRKFCEEDLKKIQRIFFSKKLNDLHDLFPLHFRTDFHLDDFKNFEGEFDIFKPGRDIKERLSEMR